MKPFYQAQWVEQGRVTAEEIAKAMGKEYDLAKAQAALDKVEREMRESTVWKNDRYQVVRRVLPDSAHGFGERTVVHLSIKRIDREPLHDWRDLQAIKNALVGPECEAIELYPAESRVVDTSNQYHLWVFADPTERLPIGWFDGQHRTEIPIGQSKQRPFEE